MRNLVGNETLEIDRRRIQFSRRSYQFGLWMQVDNAAPIPVPVQIRMPRLNMAEACPTPAIPCVSRPLRISCLGKTGDD